MAAPSVWPHRGGSHCGPQCGGGAELTVTLTELSLAVLTPPPPATHPAGHTVSWRPAAPARPHPQAVGPLTCRAGNTLRAPECLGVASLPTELAERSRVSEHAWRTGNTVTLPSLPARRTLTGPGSFLQRTAVWDELGDLPVHPVLGADVAGRAGGELLVEHVASLAHRAALQAVSPGDAGHLEHDGDQLF